MTSPQTTLPFPAPDVTVHAGVYHDGLAWAVAMLHTDGRRVRTAEAYGDGCVAGLVIEWPSEGFEGEVYFVPITTFVDHRASVDRKSLSLDACRRIGQLIRVDPDRGRKLRYWRIGDWLRSWGALIPE